MKKILVLCVALLLGTFMLLHQGCRKDETNLQGDKVFKSANVCDCIDPCNPVYCEWTDQEIVTWGHPKHQFSKTVDVICYNTLTHFVIKVKSSEQWADLLVDDVSVWGQGPVAANAWGECTLNLPSGWNGGDDYDFTLKVAGFGPPAIFQVEYVLAGECPEVPDIDGNMYRIVKIGTQTWMADNLMTTKYNDGTSIPLVTANSAWIALTTPAYCWVGNDLQTYGSVYGAFYNWYAVETGKLCPTGWHVATDADWTTLINYLGVTGAGGILKEAGLAHWNTPNTGATDSKCFTALPGGYRSISYGSFWQLGTQGHWWSSLENDANTAWGRVMYHDANSIGRYIYDKNYGFSVRCVKDN